MAGVAAIIFRPGPPRATPAALPEYPVPGTRQTLTVEVLNGSGRSALARTATRELRRKGFDVVYFGGARTLRVSQVLARQVEVGAAREVAAALGIDSVVASRDTTRRVDVSVWLGEDYRPRVTLHP